MYSAQAVTVNGALMANNNAANDGDGGAINAQSGDVTTDAISADNNTATGNGGAIAVESGNANLATSTGDVSLTNNSATNGGAVYANGDVSVGNASSTNTITGNTVTGNGGAINSTGSTTITGTTTLSDNTAATNGGAVSAAGDFTLNATGGSITFSGNTQDSGANALYMDNTSGGSTLTLNAAGNPITFYDPVRNNAANGLVSVLVTGSNTVTFDGSQYGSPSGQWSQVYGGTEVQGGTTMAVQNNAVYGAQAADVGQGAPSSFTMDSGATLAGGTAGEVRADSFTLWARGVTTAAPYVSAVSPTLVGVCRYAFDCISIIRDTGRANSFAIWPST